MLEIALWVKQDPSVPPVAGLWRQLAGQKRLRLQKIANKYSWLQFLYLTREGKLPSGDTETVVQDAEPVSQKKLKSALSPTPMGFSGLKPPNSSKAVFTFCTQVISEVPRY